MGEFIQNDDSVKTEREAVHNLMEAACSIRHDLDSISSDYGLSRSQVGVLYILKEAYPEGCSRGEIIDGLVETAPDVTRLVDRLEEEGLVERYRCKEDARVSIAKITEKGIDVFENARGTYLDYLRNMSKILTKSECETLSKLCKKIKSNLSKCNPLERTA
ncbi:MarR family transcriptional regulator [Aliifodinibius sp. S!AR15-10]|uniref:MarR family winged helix-turn-helix transcriptional regulator n=1 Tax=Aliifodinibius sp. S!AR15-10 TaxID=2950437 RepID=UPI002856F543|nr:MarR family transcriptional regulator [Aliifodinibius sp. S!AR15-10]MDR8390595.1 MarR family transcriptional regulator [Aliifodinibius sp. S!AR15-10]